VCTAATPSLATLWAPDNSLTNVSINGVTDPNNDVLTITIDTVKSDESSSLAVPGTADAFKLQNGTVNLRKQRGAAASQPGNGRVYYIGFTATDPSRASCSGTVQVVVPRTLATPVVADGANFDVTVP
jgi:hypothetical protein